MLEVSLVVSLETGLVMRVLDALPICENETAITLSETQTKKFRAAMCEQLAHKLVMPGCELCQGVAAGKLQALETAPLYFLWSSAFDLFPSVIRVLKLINDCILY